jgi:hypothetical protein
MRIEIDLSPRQVAAIGTFADDFRLSMPEAVMALAIMAMSTGFCEEDSRAFARSVTHRSCRPRRYRKEAQHDHPHRTDPDPRRGDAAGNGYQRTLLGPLVRPVGLPVAVAGALQPPRAVDKAIQREARLVNQPEPKPRP